MLLALLPLIFAGLGAAGGVAGGVASAVSSAKNASAAAAQIAEMERHNREIESQLKKGANGASTGAGVGKGIISDAASKIPVVGPFIVPILKRLGLGLADINIITKSGCISCNGISLKTVGGGLFIHGSVGDGLNLSTQNAGAGLFSGQKLQSFDEFVGALFKDIQPLSVFDIIRICKKLKVINFKGCFMRDEISNLDAVSSSDECFVMNLDESNSSGTHWIAVNIAGATGISDVSGSTYYFDSFGLPPTEEIKVYCKKPRFYNSFVFQKPNEVICGHMCL